MENNLHDFKVQMLSHLNPKSGALDEMAFQAFWGWVNHPNEEAARAAWANSDLMSKASWRRAALKLADWMQGVADAD